MTTVGRWSPNKVRARVLDGTWVSPEELGGMVLLTPTSVAYTGTSATVGANGSVEFSGITELKLIGVFSEDYDNYVIVIRNSTTSTTGTALNFKLNSGGTNTTDSNYSYQMVFANGTTVSAASWTGNASARYGTADNDSPSGDTLYLYGPYLSQRTGYRNTAIYGALGASLPDFDGTHATSASYDGITIICGSDNITGLISVYGLVGA